MVDLSTTAAQAATAVQADAAAAQQAVTSAVQQAHGIALTGFADAHAYAQHIGDVAAAKIAAVMQTGRADVAKVESSHTALFLAGVFVGALLGALATYAVMALH